MQHGGFWRSFWSRGGVRVRSVGQVWLVYPPNGGTRRVDHDLVLPLGTKAMCLADKVVFFPSSNNDSEYIEIPVESHLVQTEDGCYCVISRHMFDSLFVVPDEFEESLAVPS